jgi:AcrR family transcriptional regulator
MPKAKAQFEEMRVQAMQKIRVAGLELFARKGLAGTNIKEIATSAGISMGLLYHYYRSKDELYLALANEAMDMSIQLLTGLKASKVSPKEKIRSFVRAFLKGVQEHPDICYFIIIFQQFETNDPDANTRLNNRKLESMRLLADIIKSGQKKGEIIKGDPIQLAVMFIAATQGLATFIMTFGKTFKVPHEEVLLNVLVRDNSISVTP